jgi:hypothetical protein
MLINIITKYDDSNGRQIKLSATECETILTETQLLFVRKYPIYVSENRSGGDEK